MEEFVGTVLVISHDRYFLDKVVDRVVELRNGRLTEFILSLIHISEPTRPD